jgi:hypothetical protein
LAAALLLVSFSGCIFSPKRGDGGGGGGGPIQYPKLSTPENVLEALRLAYNDRDSTKIALIYDDTYIGTSFDPTTLVQIQLSKAQEISHVHTLHDDPGVTSVQLTYPPVETRFTNLNDPPGWATVQVSGTGLGVEIVDESQVYRLIGSGGTFEFKFIPTTPDSTSPTDTTWKIVRWTEFP